MNETDQWNALRTGDRAALEWLYRTYAPQLLRYGYAFSRDQALIEDCLQELFITLWEKHANLGETNSPKHYLFASFRRSLWKKLKKGAKRLEQDAGAGAYFEGELNVEEKTVIDEQERETRQKLKQAMQSLSGRQKEILYLKYEEGLSYEEICAMMDLKYQSARNLLTGAVRKLRDQMGALLLTIFLIFFEYSERVICLYK